MSTETTDTDALLARIQLLEQERDEALKNYQFMVERAADRLS